jgi:hypothetical protein
VFVRYDPSIKGPEAFLAASDYVARMVTESLEVDKQSGLKDWAPCFYPREDIEKLRAKWDAFGREFVGQTLRSPDPASTPNLL